MYLHHERGTSQLIALYVSIAKAQVTAISKHVKYGLERIAYVEALGQS